MNINFKQARIDNGYSKKEVAIMLGISLCNIELYESEPGKTPVDIAIRMLTVYRIPISELNKKKPCI